MDHDPQELIASFTLGHLDGLTQCHSLDCWLPTVTMHHGLCSVRLPPVHRTIDIVGERLIIEILEEMFIGNKG